MDREALRRERLAVRETAVLEADAALTGLGCTRLDSRGALGLSSEQVAQMGYLKDPRSDNDQTRFYTASRADGTVVRILFHPNENGTCRANIFSPAFYQGYGSNHDFSLSELVGTIKRAIDGDVYKD